MGREEGWRGFLRGNGTNCVRIIPYSAVQFGSYNFYKKVSLVSFRGPHSDVSQFHGLQDRPSFFTGQYTDCNYSLQSPLQALT